ncbi:hypothetical protein [Corynebacterium aquilae]|uniref:hypothetical protein n=1 Tax=Corynebacterium aquilae TaxID=203263 RepID=UPI0012EDD0B5|nr:hypothetical protein [Corynebacterium aquilae]
MTSQGLDKLFGGLSTSLKDQITFPERPAPDFQDFPFARPSAGGFSLESLSSAFAATDTGALAAIGEAWRDLSTQATELSEDIRSIASDILAANEGEAIENAAARITEIADAGAVFASNASTMAGYSDAMVSIHSAGQATVDDALLQVALIEDPEEREAAKRQLLGEFISYFDGALQEAVPPINNLMTMPGSGGGGGEIALAAHAKGNGKGGIKATENKPVTGASALSGAVNAPGVTGGATQGQFAGVESNLGDLKGIGTQAASATVGLNPATIPGVGNGTGTISPLNPAGGVGTGGGVGRIGGGGSGVSLNPVPITPGLGRAGAAGLGGLAARGLNPAELRTPELGSGRLGAVGGTNVNGVGAPGIGAMGAGIVPGGLRGAGAHRASLNPVLGGSTGSSGGAHGSRPSLRGTPTLGAVGGAAGRGISGGALGGSRSSAGLSSGARGAFGGGLATGGSGVASGTGGGATGATNTGAGAGNGAGRATPMVGGAPLAGGRGGSQNSKGRAVQKSLNEIEEEENLKALLGEPIRWVDSHLDFGNRPR